MTASCTSRVRFDVITTIGGSAALIVPSSGMVIWFSAGRGLSAFLRPLFTFAWPVLLAVAALALVIWPWANQQTQDLKDRYGRRGDLERVSPGQFQESASGRRVFTLSAVTTPNTVSLPQIGAMTNSGVRASET